jgi:outer membrane lipopolysaccharide assembly protein LptE/RlpB
LKPRQPPPTCRGSWPLPKFRSFQGSQRGSVIQPLGWVVIWAWIAILAIVFLTGCGLSVRQQIQTTDTVYTGLLTAGLRYAQQPQCPQPEPDVQCVEPESIRTMQALDRIAQAALDRAQEEASKPDTPDATLKPLAVAAASSVATLRQYLHEQGVDIDER